MMTMWVSPLATSEPRRVFHEAQMKQSAGIVLFEVSHSSLKEVGARGASAPRPRQTVLLVHPSGGYNRGAPFGIPKGEPNEGEELEVTARREVLEETGVDVRGELKSLGYIDYLKSRKRVHAWAAPMPMGAVPKCASWEIDQAEMFDLEEARKVIHKDQVPFLDRLVALLGG
jgi:predicted NUDIX family NTP pyrophosphohydrolase